MAVFDATTLAEARTIIARYPAGRERSAVMPLLYLAQSIEGRVTRTALKEVAALLGVTTAEVQAVASFYTMLRLRPTGRHVVSVCTNLSCALRGANEVFAAAREAAGVPHGQDTSEDELITLHEEECLGACEKAPVVSIDFVYHDDVSVQGMRDMIGVLRSGEVPTPSRGEPMRDFRAASRLLAGLPPQQEVDA